MWCGSSLVTKDRRSVYERLRREYKTLTNLPDHPHVVKVIWADRMADAKQTPYIVFEYVEGLDVSDLIDAEALSLDDAVRIVREAADGLAHLHKHGVYHQDIKPSNLLWTDKESASLISTLRSPRTTRFKAVVARVATCRRITITPPSLMLRIEWTVTSMPWASPSMSA